MHERSLVDDLVRKAKDAALAEGATGVAGVHVTLGAMSHLSPEVLTEAFQRATHGSLLEGAELVIDVTTGIDDPHAQDVLLTAVDVVV
ncbi:MAG: hydrogenase maturation nickel metallochaperone HypA [Acidimicrobiia bacterium]|nr:hydrogenase maturation nickel metallochaperone HypA [Acidimicrobiia bacterium]